MSQAIGSGDVRYAPPQAPVDDVDSGSGELELATRGQRFGAAMVDVAIAIAGMVLAAVLTPWNPWTAGASFIGLATNAAFGFVLFVAVHGWLLATRGQTVGKAALKLRIVRPDGSRVPFLRLLGLRYGIGGAISAIPVVGWLYGTVDALFIFRESRRCVHDLIADTIVVRA